MIKKLQNGENAMSVIMIRYIVILKLLIWSKYDH